MKQRGSLLCVPPKVMLSALQVRLASRAIELDPGMTDAFYWRARAHCEQKDILAALTDYKQILALPTTTRDAAKFITAYRVSSTSFARGTCRPILRALQAWCKAWEILSIFQSLAYGMK